MKVIVETKSIKSASKRTLHTGDQHGSYCSTSSGTSSSYNTDNHSSTTTRPIDSAWKCIQEGHLSQGISKSQSVGRSQSHLRLCESSYKLGVINLGCAGNVLPPGILCLHQMTVCDRNNFLAQDVLVLHKETASAEQKPLLFQTSYRDISVCYLINCQKQFAFFSIFSVT